MGIHGGNIYLHPDKILNNSQIPFLIFFSSEFLLAIVIAFSV